MICRQCCVVTGVLAALALAVLEEEARAATPIPAVAAAWVVSDVSQSGKEEWKLGMGFDLNAQLRVSRTLDVRADWGARWLDGESTTLLDPLAAPRWGGTIGEEPRSLRVMPATLELAHRFENWSKGRYWIPFAAAGPGFYDLRATYRSADSLERNHNLYRFGWHGRAGVQFHRTNGLFLTLESALHLIDVPGKWTPMWDVSFGLGTVLPASRR